VVWREFRLEKSGRRGWDIALPRFEDKEKPENAERMNRFYGTAAAEMEKAANLAVESDARRVRYRCETDVRILPRCDGPTPSEDSVSSEGNTEDAGKKRRLPRLLRGKTKREKSPVSEKGRPGDVRVSLRLTLAVSGQWPREKNLIQLWRDGILLSSRVL